MRKVEITVEKTVRVAKTIRVTNKQLEMLRNGENPFDEEFEKELNKEYEKGEVWYDFAVYDVENEEQIVDWCY